MIRFTDNHGPRLLRMAPEPIALAFGEELQAGAEAIVEDAVHTIDDGGISGARHVVSAPGEPPNRDTGVLSASGHAGEVVEAPGVVQTAAIFDAPYAIHLELGTSRMVERPFLSPATRRQHIPVYEALLARWRQITGLR